MSVHSSLLDIEWDEGVEVHRVSFKEPIGLVNVAKLLL
jgi:hypothetical protein